MGMCTELVIAVELKKETPVAVVEMLKYLTEKDIEQPEIPGHPLFNTERWRTVLIGDSYAFPGDTHSRIRWDDITDAWMVTIRSNLKAYDAEVKRFCYWIFPYVEADGFAGYYRYEEDDLPTLLIKDSNQQLEWEEKSCF